MTVECEFRSDVTVELVQHVGGDNGIVSAARVSTQGADAEWEQGESIGLINFLMKNRHGTPFEHNSMTFFVSAPIMVFREFHRHRIGWSYNEESARYKQLEPVFYVPGPNRPLVQEGKPGAYRMALGNDETFSRATACIKDNSVSAYEYYTVLLNNGVAREVARSVLPVNIFSSMYATCNARSLMAFLSLRAKMKIKGTPFYLSFPLYEIDMVATRIEEEFAKLFPVTHEAFCNNGRVAP